MMDTNGCSSFEKFPDHILYLIFDFLDTLSLIRASRVSCRWYNICCDKSFEKILDLRLKSRKPFKLKQLWHAAHRKLTSRTTEAHIRGPSYENKTMDKLSIPYIEVFTSKCPKLSSLSLENFDLREIPLESLPPNLKTLSLYESMLSMGWFDTLKCRNLLANLQVLNLQCCSKISNNDLEPLAYLRNVTKLNLSNCFRISARGIYGVASNLKHLRDIDFSGCPGVNNVVLYYLSNLPLEYLKLRFCHLITDHGINQLFLHSVGNTLKLLDIYSCHEVTDNTLEVLASNASCLKKLDIGACNKLTSDKVESVKTELVNCEINFEILPVNDKCFKKTNEQFCNMMPSNFIN